MNRLLIASLVLGSVLAACGGGGSGVTSSKKLLDLDSSEAGSVCDYTADVEGGYGHMKTCGDGLVLTVKERASCITNIEATSANCTATVGDAEACAEAVGDDLCKLLSEPKCAFAFQCAGS